MQVYHLHLVMPCTKSQIVQILQVMSVRLALTSCSDWNEIDLVATAKPNTKPLRLPNVEAQKHPFGTHVIDTIQPDWAIVLKNKGFGFEFRISEIRISISLIIRKSRSAALSRVSPICPLLTWRYFKPTWVRSTYRMRNQSSTRMNALTLSTRLYALAREYFDSLAVEKVALTCVHC